MFVIARSRIADYDTWKRAFDGQVDTRIRHGARGHHILRAEQDGKELTVIIEVASFGGAEGLMKDDVAHSRAMDRGRVGGGHHGGQWRIDYVDTVDTADYREGSRYPLARVAAAVGETRSQSGFAMRRPYPVRTRQGADAIPRAVPLASGKET